MGRYGLDFKTYVDWIWEGTMCFGDELLCMLMVDNFVIACGLGRTGKDLKRVKYVEFINLM